ncbi:MAG: hypothetical protein WEC84_00070 [Candidatus Andersenbacteria bacterium]
MKGGYIAWQFWYAPQWLVKLAWNIQRANFQMFSVPIMIRTLFAHWHRDALSYTGGTITGYMTTFALNQISRTIGFIICTATLMAWVVAAILLVLLSMSAIALFFLWPFMPLVLATVGISLLTGSL